MRPLRDSATPLVYAHYELRVSCSLRFEVYGGERHRRRYLTVKQNIGRPACHYLTREKMDVCCWTNRINVDMERGLKLVSSVSGLKEYGTITHVYGGRDHGVDR